MLGGSQGIRKDSTPVERTNLTHIAIHLALTGKADDDTLKTLCGNSQAILSQPANAPLAEHFKILIVLYFATRALQGTGDLYAVPVQVVEAIGKFPWGTIDRVLLAEVQRLTTADIGQILTSYRFATIYDHIQQNPDQRIDGTKALDYAESVLRMGPPPVLRAPSAPPLPGGFGKAPPPPPPPPPPPGGLKGALPAPPAKAAPAATKLPADIEALNGQLDPAQHSKLVLGLKRSSFLDIQAKDSEGELKRNALIKRALDAAKPAASGGGGDVAEQAAAARGKMIKSTIPAEELRAFWKKVRSLMPDANGKIGSMGAIKATSDLLKTLAGYIRKYEGDALDDLKKSKADLKDLRKIEDIKDILDDRVESGDFQGIIDDLPAEAAAPAAKKDADDW